MAAARAPSAQVAAHPVDHHQRNGDRDGDKLHGHRYMQCIGAAFRHDPHRLQARDQQRYQIAAGQAFRNQSRPGLPAWRELLHQDIHLDVLVVEIGGSDEQERRPTEDEQRDFVGPRQRRVQYVTEEHAQQHHRGEGQRREHGQEGRAAIDRIAQDGQKAAEGR